MSWQARALTLAFRLVVRPRLARTTSPVRAARDFERGAALAFRRPPYLAHSVDPGQVPIHWVCVGRPKLRRVVLYFHGGAFICGSPWAYRGLVGRISKLVGMPVAAPAYRLIQDAPFPAAVKDAQVAWTILLNKGYRPGDIAIAGDSAGGNLAAGLCSWALQRGERPAALYLLSPWVDLTLSGNSLSRHARSEALLPLHRMAEARDLYLACHDPADPMASPLFAAFPDAPPTLIQIGAGEALFDDAVRLAEQIGPVAKLSAWAGVPHVWQVFDGWVPEARAALKDGAAFLQAAFADASR